MNEIKKVIIPVGGLGLRFLPLSKVLPKHFFPLLDKPLFQYQIEEAMNSGIKEIIFVISPRDNLTLRYLKRDRKLEKLITRKEYLDEIYAFNQLFKDINFKFVIQKEPLGDGHAVLCAKKWVGEQAVGVLFTDDIVVSKTPCLLQMIKKFHTANAPIIALSEVEREKISSYGSVRVEKISNRLYKIKEIIEKPKPEEAPSNLAVAGKYILTPEVFDYLEKQEPSFKGEIVLAEVFAKMIKDGKIIYGYQFEGDWLECGDKEKWIKSFLCLGSMTENKK
jgi:UTP--glucose-1-phosphate uridylyltransferase